MSKVKTLTKLLDDLKAAQKKAAELEAQIAEETKADERRLAGFVGPYVARMVQRDCKFAALLAGDIEGLMKEDGITKQRDRDAKLRLLKPYLPQTDDAKDGTESLTTQPGEDESEAGVSSVPEKAESQFPTEPSADQTARQEDNKARQEPQIEELKGVIEWHEESHYVVINDAAVAPEKGTLIRTQSGKVAVVTNRTMDKDGGVMGIGGQKVAKIWYIEK